jgi:hypothetical protein
VFPQWTVLNNAIALDSFGDATAAGIASELADIYREAGVDAWALWIPSHARDLDAADSLSTLGTLKRDTTTLVMRADLREIAERLAPTALSRLAAAGHANI